MSAHSLLSGSTGSSVEEELESSKERIVQSIYDHLLRSVVVGYASNMHEMIKTGSISASEIQTPSSRQEIFPSLYQTKTPEEIQSELDRYGTEIPNRQSSRKRKLRQTPPLGATLSTDVDLFDEEQKDEEKDNDDDDDDNDGDEDFKEENIEVQDGDNNDTVATNKAKTTIKAPDTPTTIATTTNGSLEQPPPGVDIWGRIPPKEPKNPVECALCGRHVSTTRFASHLEKCMGLSTRPGIPNRSLSAQSSLK